MSVDIIKIIATICSIVGSGLLAYRVTGVLWALGRAIEAHDMNIAQLIYGPPNGQFVHFGELSKVVEMAQKKKLLVTGFALIIFSGLLQLWALVAQLGYIWPYKI